MQGCPLVGARAQHAEHGRELTVGLMVWGIRDSGLKWTIVRVPLLTNGPTTATINVRTVGDKGGVRLSRANAAGFLLQQAADSAHVGQAPFITST